MKTDSLSRTQMVAKKINIPFAGSWEKLMSRLKQYFMKQNVQGRSETLNIRMF